MVNISGFVGHTDSVVATELYCSMEVAIGNMEMRGVAVFQLHFTYKNGLSPSALEYYIISK